jgi:hypothetical protein
MTTPLIRWEYEDVVKVAEKADIRAKYHDTGKGHRKSPSLRGLRDRRIPLTRMKFKRGGRLQKRRSAEKSLSTERSLDLGKEDLREGCDGLRSAGEKAPQPL